MYNNEKNEFEIDPFKEEDKEIILDMILNVFFRKSPNKERDKKLIKDWYFHEKTDLELAEKYKIGRRRVKEILRSFKEMSPAGYTNDLEKERRRIFELIREYKL